MKPPSPTPGPAPSPQPPIPLSALVGNWSVDDGGGRDLVFALAATKDPKTKADVVTIANLQDPTSCWKTGTGGWASANNTITGMVARGPQCTRSTLGVARRRKVTKVIDLDYVYAGEVLDIVWDVRHGHWPRWTKMEMSKEFEIVLES